MPRVTVPNEVYPNDIQAQLHGLTGVGEREMNFDAGMVVVDPKV
jgi:hypothetical protein